MARIDTTGLTLDNGATRELAKLIFDQLIYSPALSESFNVLLGQRNGEQATFIGDFGLMAKEAQGCNPEYNDSLLPARGQTWDISKWGIYEGICLDEIEQLINQYELRADKYGDLSNNPYVTEVIIPRLEWAIRNEMQRLAWFGDKSAETVTDGGVIRTAAMLPYFTVLDGFWKRLFDLVTATPTIRTTIAANSQATAAAQQSAMLVSGVATGIINTMILNASPELRSAEGVIYVSLKMKDALVYDLQQNNRGSNLQWETLFDGAQATYYQGIRLVALPIWDKVINAYEGNGTKPNNPFRAVYTTKNNLLLGTTSTSELTELDVFYVEKDEKTYIRAKDYMGTMVADPNMVQVAF